MSVNSAFHLPMDDAGLGRRIALTPAEIHLWLAYYEEINGERLHAAYRELLSAAEKEQEPRFFFPKDRRRYLITRALVRTVLSRYIAVHPREWIFSENAFGRPDVVNAPAREAGLQFNISHTNSLIVLAVTQRRALGVDVENYRERRAAIGVADRFFAPQEVAALAKVSPQEQQYRFFEYWTFKEAYIKARGMGLSLPLDKFSFHYPNDHAVKIAIHPELADDAARWQFWQYRLTSEYLVAVCAERIGDQTPSLVLRQITPLLSETLVDHKCLRVSEPRPSATP